MMGRYLPSRAHVAGAWALSLAAALAWRDPPLAALPLLAFVITCLAAPFFPSWRFFLPAVLHGPRTRTEVALTFDDGPDARTIGPLLALLSRERAPATFFVVGRHAAERPDAVREMVSAGHEIGNHTWSHDTLLMIRSATRIRDEIARCQEAIRAMAGVAPLAFRPPVGMTNPYLRLALQALGLECVLFSCRPRDFANRRIANLGHRVLRKVRAGDVILLHDWLPDGASAAAWLEEVEVILAGLRAKGLAVVPLSRLLGRPVMRSAAEAAPAGGPGSAAPAAGRTRAALAAIAQAAFVVFYPLVVALGVPRFGARGAAVLLLALLVAVSGRLRALGRGLYACVAALLLASLLLDDPRFMLAYPTVVNAILLAQFAWSLRTPLPMVERFARMQVSDLRPEEIGYCRTVTGVWVGFFAVNGAAAALLALAAPRAWWALYTGAVSYALVGALFAVEYVVRKARFGRFGRNPIDQFLARVMRREVDA